MVNKNMPTRNNQPAQVGNNAQRAFGVPLAAIRKVLAYFTAFVGVSLMCYGLFGWFGHKMAFPNTFIPFDLSLDGAAPLFALGVFFFGLFLPLSGLITGVSMGWGSLLFIILSVCVKLVSRNLPLSEFAACTIASFYGLVAIAGLVTGIQKNRPVAGFLAMIFSPIGFIIIACVGERHVVVSLGKR
jgi:hypothetical protein